jgi:hypothetical protein
MTVSNDIIDLIEEAKNYENSFGLKGSTIRAAKTITRVKSNIQKVGGYKRVASNLIKDPTKTIASINPNTSRLAEHNAKMNQLVNSKLDKLNQRRELLKQSKIDPDKVRADLKAKYEAGKIQAHEYISGANTAVQKRNNAQDNIKDENNKAKSEDPEISVGHNVITDHNLTANLKRQKQLANYDRTRTTIRRNIPPPVTPTEGGPT